MNYGASSAKMETVTHSVLNLAKLPPEIQLLKATVSQLQGKSYQFPMQKLSESTVAKEQMKGRSHTGYYDET